MNKFDIRNIFSDAEIDFNTLVHFSYYKLSKQILRSKIDFNNEVKFQEYRSKNLCHIEKKFYHSKYYVNYFEGFI